MIYSNPIRQSLDTSRCNRKNKFCFRYVFNLAFASLASLNIHARKLKSYKGCPVHVMYQKNNFLIFIVLGPYYFCKSHCDPKLAVWLDPGISKLSLYFWGGSLVYASALIPLDKPSYLLRYRALGILPQPKAQWYYIIRKKGIICCALILYSINGINTQIWVITVNSLWLVHGWEFNLWRLTSEKSER